MQRICRQLFAAIIGVVSVAGVASAQNPAPSSYTPVRMGYGQPAANPVTPAANPVTPAAGVSHIRGQAGCTNCGSGGGAAATAAAPGTPGIPYAHFGPRDRNGCGSCQSDLGFIFGSCKSFFSPCGPRPCDSHGGGGLFRKNCGVHPFAAPYGTGYNGCAYDSYLNH